MKTNVCMAFAAALTISCAAYGEGSGFPYNRGTPATAVIKQLMKTTSCSPGSTITAAAPTKPEEANMWMIVGEHHFAITLADDETARAFAAMVPLTLDMAELNGNEKHADLPKSATGESKPPRYDSQRRPHVVWIEDRSSFLSDVRLALFMYTPWPRE